MKSKILSKKFILFFRIFILPIMILAGFLFFPVLTAKAESAILYQENFDSGQADNWNETTDSPTPAWQVINGKYYVKMSGKDLKATSIYQNGLSWDNFVFSFNAELNDGVDRVIYFRYKDSQNYYMVNLRGFWRWDTSNTPAIYLAKYYQGQHSGNQYTVYHFSDDNALNNETAHIDIEALGNRIRVFYNDQLVIDWQEETEDYPKSGTVGFSGWSGHYEKVDVAWDNIVVRTDWPEDPAEQYPPTIESFNQFKSDGETELYEQEITAGDSVVFKAVVDDPDGDQVKIEVEVKAYNFIPGSEFNGLNTKESDFVDSGEEAIVIWDGLVNSNYHWRLRAINNQGLISDWRYVHPDSAENPKFNFIVKKVPLYTQVESDYPSKLLTKEWSEKEYAKGDIQTYWCGSKIKDCGCAITSAVMTLRYHDITEDVEDNDINPGIINQWLKNATTTPIGYHEGNINWMAVQKYARDPQTNNLRIVFNGKYNLNYKSPPYNNHQEIEEMLDNDLELYQPVIMRDDRIGHFFVATEELANTYRINDPLWYNTKTLNQEITPADDVLPYDNYKRDYNNHYGGIRRFYALGPYDVGPFRFASLDFVIASPAELLVTYFTGSEIKRLGKDPISGEEYNEIPGGSYISEGIGNPNIMQPSEHQIKSIWIPDPMDGEYQIKVIGTGQGSYDFYSAITDLDGNSQTYTFAGHTQTNLTTAYDLDYTSLNIEAVEIIPQDTIPPATTIAIIGTQGKNDWHISDVEISLPAKDNEDGTGVFKTEYSLDNKDTWDTYINPFSITDEGMHTILFRSEDFVGNIEEIKTRIIQIDKTPPEAEIYFNAEEQELTVHGIDNLTELPVVTPELECSDKKCKSPKYVYAIKDQAGHALRLHFIISEHKQKIMAHLNKILYNNNEPINNNTRIDYAWTINKKSKTIKFLSQSITNPNDFWIKALYQLKKDQTVISVKNKEVKEKIKQTLDRLIIVKLITQSGELQYEY